MASGQAYLTTRLIFPTPGGAAGDGSIGGDLTTQGNNSSLPTQNGGVGDYSAGSGLLKVRGVSAPILSLDDGTSGTVVGALRMRIARGSDWRGLIAANSSGTVFFGDASTGDLPLVWQSNPYLEFDLVGGGFPDPAIRFTIQGLTGTYALAFHPNGYPSYLGGIALKGLGLSPIYGLDNRTALTAVDAAALTLYTTTAAGQAYHLLAHLFAREGTTPTGSYVVTFTEGGVAITKTMSVTAIDTDSDISIPCQPDNATTITAQLTAIGGTTPSMDCYTSVKEEA